MKVIIVGAGEVGRVSAETISKIHDVLVIEKDEGVSNVLKSRLNVSTLKGDGTNPRILAYAIRNHRADMIISTLNHDPSNLFVCMMAKRIKPDIRTVASITDPDYRIDTTADGVEGVDTIISPELITAEKIFKLCVLENAIDYESIPTLGVAVAIFAVAPDHEVVGSVTMHLRIPEGCTVFGIGRGGTITTETETMEIHSGDHLMVFGTDDAITSFNELMGVEYPARTFCILGGTIAGRNAARMLAAAKKTVKILDRDEALCVDMARSLNGVSVTCADFTDPRVQTNEGVFRSDATISTCHKDDTNLLVTMTAQRHDARKVVSRYFTKDYEDIFRYTGIETIIGYYRIVSNEITKCTIADETAIMQGNREGDVFFIYNVTPSSPLRDRYLGDLRVPDGVRIVAIRREGALLYPRLDTRLLEGDSAIVFATDVRRSELAKVFGKSSLPEV